MAAKLYGSRVRKRIGAPGAPQLVSMEITIGLVLAGLWIGSMPVLVGTQVAAALLLLTVFGRTDGRWLYESAAIGWRRRHSRAAARRAGARLAAAQPRASALATLTRKLSVRGVADRGRTIGVGQDDSGWFAGVGLGQRGDLSNNRPVRVDLEMLARILEETGVPISALQLVRYRTLGPTQLVDAAAPAVASYRELAGPDGCPVNDAVWIVVRLTPIDALIASSERGGGLEGVDRALAAAVGRIEKALTSDAVSHRVLDVDGLRDALGLACGLELLASTESSTRPPTGSSTGSAAVDPPALERRGAWHAGGLAHVSFTVTGWPNEPVPDLLEELARLPASAVSVALALRPNDEQVALLGLVRVVTPPDGVTDAVAQLKSNAGRLGVRLRRLDGEQARAVYATAPTGAAGTW